MRWTDEQQVALECLKIAEGNIPAARAMLAFVTGRDADDAKDKLEEVRKIVSP